MLEPKNEMGVIMRFASIAEANGFTIVSAGTAFPDAMVERNGKIYRTEFEFEAKNFIDHNHDPRLCDLIICWEDNYSDCALTVLALSDTDWNTKEIRLPSDLERELCFWKQMARSTQFWMSRAIAAEAKLTQFMIEEGRYDPSTDNTIQLANERADLVTKLHQQGKNNRQISLEVFGYAGGAAYDFIKRTLAQLNSSEDKEFEEQ